MGRNGTLACGDRCSGVSATGRPSTVRHAPMSDLRRKSGSIVPCKSPGQVGQAGLHWTVEVEHVLETPSHPAAEGGILALLRPIENAAANVAGQADRLGSGGSCPHTSQRILVGAETDADKNVLPLTKAASRSIFLRIENRPRQPRAMGCAICVDFAANFRCTSARNLASGFAYGRNFSIVPCSSLNASAR